MTAARPTRSDYEMIARWVQPKEKVLDLGCGDGALLAFLTQKRQILGYGIENDVDRVQLSIQNGINVIQLDLEQGLPVFEDNAFDHVIMSLSLQSMHNTVGILKEMLRVGRKAVVSFPNFGFIRYREAIAQGRMPVSDSLPYQWYNTPNVRFFTMADFEALCTENQIAIFERCAFHESIYLGDLSLEEANLNASMAMYRLGRVE